MVYVLVFISVVGMTAGQLFAKKGVLQVGGFPQNLGELGDFFSKAYTNAYILSAVFLNIMVALAWILALSKAQLSHIYPFMALSYVLVALFFADFQRGCNGSKVGGNRGNLRWCVSGVKELETLKCQDLVVCPDFEESMNTKIRLLAILFV